MAKEDRITISKDDVGELPRPKPQLTADQIRERAEQEALRRSQAARRTKAVLDAGFTCTGLRLSNPKDSHATGSVVTFDENEQAQIVDAVRRIVDARK